MNHASRIFFILVGLSLVWAVACAAAPEVRVNGAALELDRPPFESEGEVYVSLTDTLGIALDVEIEDEVAGGVRVARLTSSTAVMEFTVGDTLFWIGDAVRELPAPAVERDGATAVPLAPVLQHLDFDVQQQGSVLLATREHASTLLDEIPEPILEPEPEPVVEATATTEMPFEEDAFQFTYENSIQFDNVTVSGNTTLSNLEPRTEFTNRFNLRAIAALNNGYEMNSTLRTTATTDDDFRHGEVTRFFSRFEKGKIALTVYDLFPKVSKYTLKNYHMQGVMYERENNLGKWSAMWGKTPKRNRESRYNRYVRALNAEHEIGGVRLGAGYVRVRDTGALQDTDRLDNAVANLMARYEDSAFKVAAEYARSDTRVFHEVADEGRANLLNVSWAKGTSNIIANYEHTGSEFVSETAFFTSGRREASLLINERLNKRTSVGLGAKDVRLLGESTLYLPAQLDASPFAARPKLKLSLRRNYERTRSSSGTRFSDRRRIDLSDRFGPSRLRVTLERRGEKDTDGERSYRTTQRYRLSTPMSEKIDANFQFRKEYRTGSTSPRNRFMQARFVYEFKEWHELILATERYYNDSDYNRVSINVGLRIVDIYNDREFSLDYTFINYSAHNDNVFGVKYSFFK